MNLREIPTFIRTGGLNGHTIRLSWTRIGHKYSTVFEFECQHCNATDSLTLHDGTVYLDKNIVDTIVSWATDSHARLRYEPGPERRESAIIGYRATVLGIEDGRLVAYSPMIYHWNSAGPPEKDNAVPLTYDPMGDEAQCEAEWGYGHEKEELSHIAPAWGCSCGFYAWRTTENLRKQSTVSSKYGVLRTGWKHLSLAYVDARFPDGSYLVPTTVELRGKIIEHEHGYRAQHMRLRSVVLPKRGMDPYADALLLPLDVMGVKVERDTHGWYSGHSGVFNEPW